MIKHFYFSLMKTVCFFLVLLFFSTHCFSQNTENPFSEMRELSPFKENGSVVGCLRDWMMSRERMDSLKQEVKLLEEQLVSLPKEPFGLGSDSYMQLYTSEYEVRIESSGEISEWFCVSDDEAGKRFNILDSGEAAFDQMQIFGGNYLVVASKYHYLGNCRIFTTVKKYYVRKD